MPSDNERLKATGLGYLLYGGYTALTRLQMRFGFWDEAIKDLQISNKSASFAFGKISNRNFELFQRNERGRKTRGGRSE